MEKLSKKKMQEIISLIGCRIFLGGEYQKVEKFKQVVLHDTFLPYIVSSFGRVFSLHHLHTIGRPIELKQSINHKGYNCVKLQYNRLIYNISVHRLVALMFIKNKNPMKNTHIDHIDTIKTHNYIWNLEWVTPKENTLRAERNGLAKHLTGTEHPGCKHTLNDIRNVCRLLSTTNKPINEISKITGVTPDAIRDIKRGKTWKFISKDYDFSKYNFGHVDISDKVHEICKYAETNNYTMKEISSITGISYPIVKAIIEGKNYKNISCKYDISKFNNYETHKS